MHINQQVPMHMNQQTPMPTSQLVPMVLTRDSNGERAMDLFSRMLQSRIIDLSAGVDPTSCSLIRSALLFLANEDPEKDIDLYLDSPGGHVMSGMSVVDTMRIIKPKVNVYCAAMAASMGSVILAGATGTRYALPHSQVMLHQVMSGTGPGTQVADMGISTAHAYNLNMDIKRFFAKCTGRSREELDKVMDRDTWFTAEKAKEFGLVDEILEYAHGFEHDIDDSQFPYMDDAIYR